MHHESWRGRSSPDRLGPLWRSVAGLCASLQRLCAAVRQSSESRNEPVSGQHGWTDHKPCGEALSATELCLLARISPSRTVKLIPCGHKMIGGPAHLGSLTCVCFVKSSFVFCFDVFFFVFSNFRSLLTEVNCAQLCESVCVSVICFRVFFNTCRP